MRYRSLPYFEHLGTDEVFDALDRVRQANLLQMQLKMQKDCSYLQHMDDGSLEGRNAESIRKRVQEGKLQGGFRQLQSSGKTVVCGCLDCQLRLCNKQFSSSFLYEQARDALVKKAQQCKLTFSGAAWHRRLMLTMHLATEALDDMGHLGTALHVAVLRGEAELVRFLCSRSECNASAAWGGVTALDLAIAKGFEEGGEVLLQHTAQLKHFSRQTLTEAVERGSTLLLQQAGQSDSTADRERDILNASGDDGNTALHLACTLPNREAMVKVLVVAGAKFNLENFDGATPLDCCVQESNKGAWKALRQAAGNQAKCRRFEAALRSLEVAITSNCMFLVRNVHLRQEEDGGKADKSERRAAELSDMLHLAVRTPHVNEEIVRLLLEQGADVNAIKDGYSVLDACLQANQISPEDVLSRSARLEKFSDYNIMRASEENLPGLVRYLVSGKKVNKEALQMKQKGMMALHVAAKLGHDAVVKALLEAKCNVHDLTSKGASALDLACEEFSRFLTSSDSRSEVRGFSSTIVNLHARGCKLKTWKTEEPLKRAKEVLRMRSEEESLTLSGPGKEDFEAAGKKQKKRREESDEVLRQVEREVRACVAEEEKKADAYKESEKLARRVVEARQVLQASLYGEGGEKVGENQSSSKFYQIRIDVLRRKMQEKDGQIEEALRKVDFAEEDYIWVLRKRMRDLRLRYHPDKITDRQVTDEDYKFYEKLTKAYDVVCSREERDKYLEVSNHVAWLEQQGEEEEARIVEKAMHGVDPQKKAKADRQNDDGQQVAKAHVERAKKKLQERREEETSWDKAGQQPRALTLGTPNKCKAPQVSSQRFAQDQFYLDMEWVCKASSSSAERIEYQLHFQAIDKDSSSGWAEAWHGWDSSAREVGPFSVGTYEFMVRARNSVGWGDWSDVAVICLEDPKWEKQWKKEAELHVMKEQGKNVQMVLQELLDEVHEMREGSKLTIHRASNLLFQLHMETKRARPLRSVMPKPAVLKDAEDLVKELEKWRDRKEAFAEWRTSLQDMKARLLREAVEQSDAKPRATSDSGEDANGTDLLGFLGQDSCYFGSLPPQIRNLVVQTLLGFDSKQVFKKLTSAQKDSIVEALRFGIELGRAPMPAPSPDMPQEAAKDRSRTIFTKHQTEQLQKLRDRFSTARCAAPARSSYNDAATGAAPDNEELQDAADGDSSSESAEEEEEAEEVEAAAYSAPPPPPISLDTPTPSSPSRPAKVPKQPAQPPQAAPESATRDIASSKANNEKRLRTLYISNLPVRNPVPRQALIDAIRPYAEVDAARMGVGDALIRFTQPSEAKAALSALDHGCITLQGQFTAKGALAPTDTLTDEALQRAGGRHVDTTMAKPSQPPQPPPQLPQSQQAKPAAIGLPPPKQPPVGHPQLVPPAVAQQVRIQQPGPQLPPPKLPPSTMNGGMGISTAPLPPPAVAGTVYSTGANAAGVPPQESFASAEPEAAPRAVPRIRADQLLNPEADANNVFKCLLCNGVVWLPKLTTCCNKVFCTSCLDEWLLCNNFCPKCPTPLAVRDGSTGSCGEQRVRKIDRNATGVHAVLWRVYGSLKVRCQRADCGWTGQIANYEEHMVACTREHGAQPFTAQVQDKPDLRSLISGGYPPVQPRMSPNSPSMQQYQQQPPAKASAAAQSVQSQQPRVSTAGAAAEAAPAAALASSRSNEELRVASRLFEGADSSQLTLQQGEQVYVRNRDPTGWTFVVKVTTAPGSPSEGWVPDWLLQS
eukprot:CAMPEP_0178371076 /NCGR_PEP_ID=MMETSP0689_2-20121128/637_1 /TAXON_ID=160604 /ORGANISM="Amphidinium massartii, Strain CS-259" /LENGTH=1737 /DNA_ID=CAMNT_0019990929 /DNA_START=15 /DNA_END=5229 /DNA_ORIENTATION=-